ncbi:hypothetical protein M0638_27930 [Roseomonas sp. NAR14]|uniref:Uncharacterized protein n=1 Tax=Roseomonas acroporae TaxID=2937791 RepID=A0A9X1YFZ7_9PROT|nr:hypothetical protein [Roseomonas acroporae]MCK8788183.1 hypothetical protein [Roseomonas acroporae]
MAVAYHMVHYRLFRLTGSDKTAPSLEVMCRDVLNTTNTLGEALWARVRDRMHVLPPPDERQLILNKVADLKSAVFGEMCLVEAKGLQALLELKTANVALSDLTIAEIYALQERSAPTGSHFIRGMAYWMAISNHLFFVRLHSMGHEHLRQYFEWLLKGELQKIDGCPSFSLQAEFDVSTTTADIGDIRSLRVKGKSAPQFNVVPIIDPAEKRTVATARSVADKFVQFAQALPVVQALFGQAKAQSLIESLGPEEYLSVDASVKIRGRRTVRSKEQLREIASSLADMTEGDVQVEGRDGKVSDGDAILRTRMPFALAHEGSNYLEFDNVADQIQEVYSRFVQDGKIKA